ncbi:hypothetical protein [Roseomonas chloroacetimidivorans]|uniref:hypothetical protein n=1 Tax=Roseomonas chloroacetimidivorans TaxID=1766656 RepID=UPI003C718AF0
MNPFGRYVQWRVRVTLVSMVAIAAVGFAFGQTAEAPPRLDGLPSEVRGFPRHGETIGAALACGLRSQQWAESYRARLNTEMQRRSPSGAADAGRVLAEREAYARRQVSRNRNEFCADAANPTDLATGDRIVSGAERNLP